MRVPVAQTAHYAEEEEVLSHANRAKTTAGSDHAVEQALGQKDQLVSHITGLGCEHLCEQDRED